MSIDTSHERIGEEEQRRRTVSRLAPAAKPGRGGKLSAPSFSPESADRSPPRERNEPNHPNEDAKDARSRLPLPAWLVRLGYYGLALLLVALATMVRWALGEALNPAPFLVFYLAWVAAAAFGGLGPGLLATLASWLCVNLWFDSTPWRLGFGAPGSISRLVVLLAGGLAVSVVGEKMRRSRIDERRQRRELAHLNAALWTREEKYRFLVENSTDVTWTVDLQGRWTFVSGNVEKATGYRADEVRRMTLWEFLAPECHDLVKDKLRRRARGEDFPPYEVMVVSKDGRHIPFEVVTASIVDEAGNVVGVQGVSRDITERKRAEAALRESEAKYRFLVENSKDVTWMVDLQGTWTFISSNVEDVAGYRADELIGQSLWDFLAPECHDLVKEKLRRRLSGEDLPPYEILIVGKDGRRIPFEVHAASIVDDRGNTVGVQGVSRDITERKRAQEALAESRQRYRGLVEKVNDWVWEIDANGVYTYSSPRALDLLGYAPEEIVGKTPFDLMPPAEAQRVWKAFQPTWLERKPLERLENTLVRKDGRLVTVETSGMPVFAEDGSFLGYTGVDRDVTERKWAEEQLRRSEQDLNRAQAVAQTGSWRLDIRRNQLLWSQETYRIFGIPAGTPMTYEAFLAAVHPTDREYVDRRWTAALRGEPYDIEHRILVEGELKWVREKAELEFDEAGTLLGGFGTVQDITGRKRAEEALRASQESLALAQEIAHLGNWSWDLRTDEQEWSDESFRIFGVEPGECRPNRDTYLALLHPEDRERFLACWKDALETNVPFNVDYRIIRRDGSVRHIRSEGQIVRDDEGQPVRVFGINQDITERQRAEEALRELNATLESRVAQRTAQLQDRARQLQKLTLELTDAEERERQRLAEILHDDLQQVLVAAKFQVGLLDGRVRNDVESQEIVGQAKDLLVDAIAKSRSLSHELRTPALSQGDLREAFEWLAEQMQKKHGFTVHLDMGERIELASEPLRVLLYKAAQELLFNAIKHAGVHEAKLRLRRQRGRIRLSVSDKGRGFDPTELGGNLGFGLLSIRERVGYLGGRMKIRSAIGKGSTFLLSVPDAEICTGE